MKERDLYRAVDKLLPETIHRQSLTGAAMTSNGTPDRLYDGPGGLLFVEYKMLKSIPRDGVVRGAYTALQLHWMERRWRNYNETMKFFAPRALNWTRGMGYGVAGIVGLPNKTAVIQLTPNEWREGSPITNAVPIKDVTAWIRDCCG